MSVFGSSAVPPTPAIPPAGHSGQRKRDQQQPDGKKKPRQGTGEGDEVELSAGADAGEPTDPAGSGPHESGPPRPPLDLQA